MSTCRMAPSACYFLQGRHITAHLLELLHRRGYALHQSSDFDSVRAMKEQLCYVASDYQREMKVAGGGKVQGPWPLQTHW